MSFLEIKPAPARLNRSQLFVVANRPETFEAAAASEADVIMFEIEDAVPPDEKPQARKNIIESLNEIDWGRKSISMRINGLDTPYMYRDLVDILEAPSERLDLVLIPRRALPPIFTPSICSSRKSSKQWGERRSWGSRL